MSNNNATSSEHHNAPIGLNEINDMANRLSLSREIVDRAKNLLKMVHDGKILKGRHNDDAIALACLFIACRQEGVPRTFKEICAISKISKKEIGRCYKHVLKALDMSVDHTTTDNMMPRFSSKLGLSNSVQKAATDIARAAVELDIVPGRSPLSVSASAIYMASHAAGLKLTIKEIGDVVGVAESTIRQSYKLLYPEAEKVFPKDFNFVSALEWLPLPETR